MDKNPDQERKKNNGDKSVFQAVGYHFNQHPENIEHNRILEPFT
jgi:hypothetical protein